MFVAEVVNTRRFLITAKYWLYRVESCPQTRLHGGLSKLHSADDDAVAWLTSYGS